jgi:hypothetical protein
MASAGGFNFIQPGVEPPLQSRHFCTCRKLSVQKYFLDKVKCYKKIITYFTFSFTNYNDTQYIVPLNIFQNILIMFFLRIHRLIIDMQKEEWSVAMFFTYSIRSHSALKRFTLLRICCNRAGGNLSKTAGVV